MPIATDAVPAISPVEEPRPVAPASDSQPLPTSIEPVATDTPGELPTVDPRDDLFTESPIVEKPVTEESAPEIATEPEPTTEEPASEIATDPEPTTEEPAPEIATEPEPATEEPAPEIATEPEPAVLPLDKKTDKKTDEAVDEEENLFDDVPEASIDDELSSPAAARPVDAKPALDEPGAPEEDLFAEPANKTDEEMPASDGDEAAVEEAPADLFPEDAAVTEDADLFREEPATEEAAPASEEAAPTKPAPKDEEPAESDPFAGTFKVPHESSRRWLDNTGMHETVGVLIEVQPDQIRILKANGAYATVPLKRLCSHDRAYVETTGARLAAEQRSATAHPLETAGL